MDTTYRTVGLRSDTDIFKIIEAFKEAAKGHICEGIVEEQPMYVYLRLMNKAKKIYGWYDANTDELKGVLVWDILANDWYTTRSILCEVLVLSIDGGVGIQRKAIQALEDIASYEDVALICTGNYMSQGDTAKMVANGYTKAGYNFKYNTFLKRIGGDGLEQY